MITINFKPVVCEVFQAIFLLWSLKVQTTHTHTRTHRHAHMRTHSFAVLLCPSLFQLNRPIPEAVNAILMDGESLGNKCQFWKENKS